MRHRKNTKLFELKNEIQTNSNNAFFFKGGNAKSNLKSQILSRKTLS